MSSGNVTFTDTLNRWAEGDGGAAEEAFAQAYDRLRTIAHAHLRQERRSSVVQTTSLVHEAYLKLADQRHLRWHSREHFFAFAARVIRRILVDQARHRSRQKRGGLAVHVTADGSEPAVPAFADGLQVLDLHGALKALEKVEPIKAELVELRFFGGLTMEEAADVLELSPATAYRHWSLAKAWLYERLCS